MRKPRNSCKLCVVLIVFVCLLVLAKFYCSNEYKLPESKPKLVEVEVVVRKDLRHQIDLIGTIRPKHYCVLIAKAGGTVDTLVSQGSVLHKGDIIARIENPDIEKKYTLSVMEKDLAQKQYNRALMLQERLASSQKATEDIFRQLICAEKSLAHVNIERENMHVRAPFDGTLGVYKIKDGEQVREGESIAVFYNNKHLMVEFDIPSQYISKIDEGQEVVLDGRCYSLTYVQKAIDEENFMCPASFDLPASIAKNMIIGSTVDLSLTVEHKDNRLVVPSSAVFLREGKDSVYVVRDGKAELSNVTIGIKNNGLTEIITGISEGDRVVSSGQNRLFPGIKVQVAEAKP